MKDYPAVIDCGEVTAGMDVTFQRRLVALGGTGDDVPNEGNAISRADVTAITCQVFDQEFGVNTLIGSPAIATSAVGPLVVDDSWVKDGSRIDQIGRNFLHTVPGENFAATGCAGVRHVGILYEITLVGGSKLNFGFKVRVKDIKSEL